MMCVCVVVVCFNGLLGREDESSRSERTEAEQ